jgi:hypothetical protein
MEKRLMVAMDRDGEGIGGLTEKKQEGEDVKVEGISVLM